MLACQHGSAYRGDGTALLRELAGTIESGNAKLSQPPTVHINKRFSEPIAPGWSARPADRTTAREQHYRKGNPSSLLVKFPRQPSFGELPVAHHALRRDS
jgi:hypothetical protein